MRKYLSRVVCLTLFIVGAYAIYFGFDYIISDDTNSQTRVTFHDFYEENEIDYLFLGTSHSVRAINAVQLSDGLNASVFNLSTSNQDFVGAYYLLKEAINSKQINHVFYEVSISRLMVEENDETKTYIISDYMRSPLVRAEYLLASFGPEKYINAFLRLRRNIDPQNPPDAETLVSVYTMKHGSNYTQYVGTENYMGKGQWTDTQTWVADEGTAALNLEERFLDNFTVDDIQEKEWRYFLKIIELCSEKGIDLTFYIAPYSELYLISFDQYEAITERVYDVAEANGIDVVDFNKIKEEYLAFGLTDFCNSDHINQEAGEKIAGFLVQYIKNPDGNYFYDDIDDKYPIGDRIIAVGYHRFLITNNTAEGTDVTSLRLEISALSHIKRPVNIRMWQTLQSEDDESVWIDGEEIEGKKLDDYSTQFIVPFNGFETVYKVDLLEPGTNEVLYEALTRFDMD